MWGSIAHHWKGNSESYQLVLKLGQSEHKLRALQDSYQNSRNHKNLPSIVSGGSCCNCGWSLDNLCVWVCVCGRVCGGGGNVHISEQC